MKTSNKLFYCLTLFLLLGSGTQAQFLKKLAKKAQNGYFGTFCQNAQYQNSHP